MTTDTLHHAANARPDAPSQPPGARSIRRRMAARLFGVSLFGALALLLSGCVGMRLESTFNEDGSARHSVRTTIEKESLEQLESMTEGFGDFSGTPEPGTTPEGDDSDSPADTFEISDEDLQGLRDAGFEVERIDTEDELGLMIARDFSADISLTDAFNELIRAGSEDDADSDADMPLGAIAGALTRDGDTWTLDLNIDSDTLFESTEEDSGDGSATPEAIEPEFDLESLGIDFDIEYIANFPYEVTETNGTRDANNPNRVLWDLPMTGNTALNALVNASSGNGGSDSSSRLPWIIGGIVLAALGGAFIAVMMARRKTTPAAATAGAAGPVGTPPTDYTATPAAPTLDTADAPAPPTMQSPPQANNWTPPASAPTGPWNPPPPNTPAS